MQYKCVAISDLEIPFGCEVESLVVAFQSENNLAHLPTREWPIETTHACPAHRAANLTWIKLRLKVSQLPQVFVELIN